MPQLEFRDGFREVPPHLASLMRGMETFRYTYREAIQLANNSLFKDWINGQQDKVLRRHAEEHQT